MFRRYTVAKHKARENGGWTKRKHEKKYGKKYTKSRMQDRPESPPVEPLLPVDLVLLVVSSERRFFVAHEEVLSRSPFFGSILSDMEGHANKVVELPDEEPEILSCVLEFLYKGDYFPRLLHNELENAQDDTATGGRGSSEATIFHPKAGDVVLRDTVVYCAAEKYGLEDLKRLALRKQGFQNGIPVPIILRSARYAYDNTPDSDSQLRAHYLAMIIRTREIFKKSGTMQTEMEKGHEWFFDLFVAMCNHMDDLEGFRSRRAPRS